MSSRCQNEIKLEGQTTSEYKALKGKCKTFQQTFEQNKCLPIDKSILSTLDRKQNILVSVYLPDVRVCIKWR